MNRLHSEHPPAAIDGRLGYGNPDPWQLLRDNADVLRIAPSRRTYPTIVGLWAVLVAAILVFCNYFDELWLGVGGAVLLSITMLLMLLLAIADRRRGDYLLITSERVIAPRAELSTARDRIVCVELVAGSVKPGSSKVEELHLLYHDINDAIQRVPIAGGLCGGRLEALAVAVAEFGHWTFRDRR